MKPHPCRDCLVISVCKQRKWIELLNNCMVVREYIFTGYDAGSKDHITEVVKVKAKIERTFIELYPNYWKPATQGNNWVWETKVIKS